MHDQVRRPFSKRAFVAVMAAFTGLGLPVTGLLNHCLGFDPLTPERHAWMAAHNVLGILFVVFAIWHIALNYRALAHHLVAKALDCRRVSREALVAVAFTGVILCIAVGHAFHVH